MQSQQQETPRQRRDKEKRHKLQLLKDKEMNGQSLTQDEMNMLQRHRASQANKTAKQKRKRQENNKKADAGDMLAIRKRIIQKNTDSANRKHNRQKYNSLKV